MSLCRRYYSTPHAFSGRHTAGETYLRILPPQLTGQALARFLGAAQACWVLEDFHKVAVGEKTRLAQLMKVFMDVADEFALVKIVAIGAVDTARQVVEYDPEMRNRVAEIHVPLMANDEIIKIIQKGEDLLNFKIVDDVRKGIVRYSSGLAAVCHHLCLNICNAAGIEETMPNATLISQRELKTAVDQYLAEASDTLKAVFDKALRAKKKSRYDNPRILLQTIASLGDDGATQRELLAAIQLSHKDYPLSNLAYFLKQLQGPERGAVLRYDGASGRYSFTDPLFRAFALALFAVDAKPAAPNAPEAVKVPSWDHLLRTILNELAPSIARSLSDDGRTKGSMQMVLKPPKA